MRRLARLASAVLAAALVPGALAHVFWIHPSTHMPRQGEAVRLEFRVGDEFPGDKLPRVDARIVRFVASPPGGGEAVPIAGMDGREPAGTLRADRAGLWIVAYQSTPTAITLEADKFEAYLKEDGLEHVSTWRAQRGQSSQPAKERYLRCAKSLLMVPGAPAAGWDRPTGLRMELVPLDDPAALAPGRTARFRVVFEGKPLPGALVKAQTPDAPGLVTARTDAAGEVAIELRGSTSWLIDAVHMVEAPAESGVQWESIWASLTMAPATLGTAPTALPAPTNRAGAAVSGH